MHPCRGSRAPASPGLCRSRFISSGPRVAHGRGARPTARVLTCPHPGTSPSQQRASCPRQAASSPGACVRLRVAVCARLALEGLAPLGWQPGPSGCPLPGKSPRKGLEQSRPLGGAGPATWRPQQTQHLCPGLREGPRAPTCGDRGSSADTGQLASRTLQNTALLDGTRPPSSSIITRHAPCHRRECCRPGPAPAPRLTDGPSCPCLLVRPWKASSLEPPSDYPDVPRTATVPCHRRGHCGAGLSVGEWGRWEALCGLQPMLCPGCGGRPGAVGVGHRGVHGGAQTALGMEARGGHKRPSVRHPQENRQETRVPSQDHTEAHVPTALEPGHVCSKTQRTGRTRPGRSSHLSGQEPASASPLRAGGSESPCVRASAQATAQATAPIAAVWTAGGGVDNLPAGSGQACPSPLPSARELSSPALTRGHSPLSVWAGVEFHRGWRRPGLWEGPL